MAKNGSTDNWVYKKESNATPGIFYKPAGVTWPDAWNGVITRLGYWTLADLTD